MIKNQVQINKVIYSLNISEGQLFSILNEMNLVNLIISYKAYNLLEIYGLNYNKWFIDVQLDNLLFELFLIIDPIITYKCST